MSLLNCWARPAILGSPGFQYLKPAASHEVLESMFLESNIRGSRFILPASFRRSTRRMLVGCSDQYAIRVLNGFFD